jgi:hypothetical protein
VTIDTHRQIARTAMWVSVGMNVGIICEDLALRQDFNGAMFASVIVVVLTSWLWLVTKIDQRLDADLGHAVADRRVAELTLAAVEDAHRSGRYRIEVGVDASPRAH